MLASPKFSSEERAKIEGMINGFVAEVMKHPWHIGFDAVVTTAAIMLARNLRKEPGDDVALMVKLVGDELAVRVRMLAKEINAEAGEGATLQ